MSDYNFGKSEFKISDLDKDKVKMFFTMLGEVAGMIIGLFSIFKKNEKNEKKDTDNNN